MNQKGKKPFLLKVAERMGTKSVNQACMLWFHQPQVPEAMMKKASEDLEKKNKDK